MKGNEKVPKVNSPAVPQRIWWKWAKGGVDVQWDWSGVRDKMGTNCATVLKATMFLGSRANGNCSSFRFLTWRK